MARTAYVPLGERISFALARLIEDVTHSPAYLWSQRWLRRVGITGRAFVIAIPYLWLLLFFLIPFALVLKISFAEAVLAMPPYTPLLQWLDGHFIAIKLDVENFLFLLHGAQSRVKSAGENAANYANAEFDRLFERMKNMDNGPARQAIIDRMVEIARRDAPWVWSSFPKNFSLQHAWVHNSKPNQMANNGLKYLRIDPALRVQMRREWNRPVLWPLAAAFLVLGGFLVPAIVSFRRRERRSATA